MNYLNLMHLVVLEIKEQTNNIQKLNFMKVIS